jgi:hypothetical protein
VLKAHEVLPQVHSPDLIGGGMPGLNPLQIVDELGHDRQLVHAALRVDVRDVLTDRLQPGAGIGGEESPAAAPAEELVQD